MTQLRPVGLIGLGLLGQALVHRLRARALTSSASTSMPAKTARLVELRRPSLRRPSPTSRALRADRSRGVQHRPGRRGGRTRIAAGAGRGLRQRIVLCASTCDPDRIAALGAARGAARAAAAGNTDLGLERPGGARRGRRADRRRSAVLAEVEPLLRALFPTYFHIGKIGDGGRAKLAVNLILGLNRLALAEGLIIRRAARSRSRGLPQGGAHLGRLFAGHGREGRQDGRRRLRRRRPDHPAPQGRASDAGAGRTHRPATAGSSRSMPTCWKPACARARATSTTVP